MSSVSAVQPHSVNAVEEWRELESDPGVFSLLIEDYGVWGVKVEEVYDLTTKFDSHVYGFVFLFRYELSDRRVRKRARDIISTSDCFVLETEIVNQMFFAHQIINNSCATHALLSVLLNCCDLNIGHNLTKLKEFTKGLDPESKGFAIANMMELAHIHNKHARPPSVIMPQVSGRRASVMSSAQALLPETYHFVSFVPINGRLFELDGLREYPIDHGPWGEHEQWTDLFLRTISFRVAQSQNFLFNLMALIPDPVPEISKCLQSLHTERNSFLDVAIELAKEVNQSRMADQMELSKVPVKADIPSQSISSNGACESKPSELSAEENKKVSTKVVQDTEDVFSSMDTCQSSTRGSFNHLLSEVARSLPLNDAELEALVETSVDSEPASLDAKLHVAVSKVIKNHKAIERYEQKLKEEVETKQRFRVEHSRRIHDYDQFIFDFVKSLAHNKQLPERLLQHPSITQPLRRVSGNSGGMRRKRNGGRKAFKVNEPKRALLLNGAKVG